MTNEQLRKKKIDAMNKKEKRSFRQELNSMAKIAMELGYGGRVAGAIREAKSEAEAQMILKKARMAKMH